jgi:hypothetical protein
MRIGDQILITDGAYQGFTGTITEIDPPWVSLVLRDGTRMFCAASIVKVFEDQMNMRRPINDIGRTPLPPAGHEQAEAEQPKPVSCFKCGRDSFAWSGLCPGCARLESND